MLRVAGVKQRGFSHRQCHTSRWGSGDMRGATRCGTGDAFNTIYFGRFERHSAPAASTSQLTARTHPHPPPPPFSAAIAAMSSSCSSDCIAATASPMSPATKGVSEKLTPHRWSDTLLSL